MRCDKFVVLALVLLFAVTLAAQSLPSGFQDTTAISGLTAPTVVRFLPDGRVFVAQKNGMIYVYDSLGGSRTLYADLRTQVNDYWDRGLLAMALDPNFTNGRPYVYVLYTYDKLPNGTQVPQWNDGCPSPPGPTTDGCVVTARLSRLQPSGVSGAPTEVPLITDWCQQFPSHSIGTVQFGPDGALYVSAGDGASFSGVDYGQYGGSPSSPTPRNPCGDPPVPVGGVQSPPNAAGGALRSLSLLRPAGNPISIDGAILRLDPDTGAALPGNPLANHPDANAQRIIAYGLRNPFRFTFRPGTSEIWVGDVGWNEWEEVNRIINPLSTPLNFGWPCYEGNAVQPGYQSANLSICQSLYNASGAATPPYYTYNHSMKAVAGEACPVGGSAITGLAFYTGSAYPSTYSNALFFADHSRNCIWAMTAGNDGLPSSSGIKTFVSGALNPVMLEIGPNGDLFYVDLEGGTIRRIRYTPGNQAPVAVAVATTPTTGNAPLTVQFDGTGSYDPDGGTLTYSWDLNGDGVFGDSTIPQPSFTYTSSGNFQVRLRVTDDQNGTGTSNPITISVGNTAPVPRISNPSTSKLWYVGQNISFSGSATDTQDGSIPASRMQWSLSLVHCDYFNPSSCHSHLIQTWNGVSGASFRSPDHEYPAHLVLSLTATDSGGLTGTTSIQLNPATTVLSFTSTPPGLTLSVNGRTQVTPFTRTVVQRSVNTISAVTPQTVGGRTYTFVRWSDRGAQTHTVTAPNNSKGATYTATYQ
ncbi:MAG TPA: PQQ-dependent sugar dehydrogenase [Terriglobales bacterium]|nr:PQQ-dependent sugar dehydrogenase [Terriglobales bacterium]